MKTYAFNLLALSILILMTGCNRSGLRSEEGNTSTQQTSGDSGMVTYDNENHAVWGKEFELVEIRSSIDGEVQKAYFHASRSPNPQPLVVSLHTWSGNFEQADPLAGLCLEKDLNYIHPDFRGPNKSVQACCSELALTDLDESIDYAMEQAKLRPSRIYIIGVSGGGYATLCMLMKSRHRVDKFSAWVPISDLSAWYRESRIRGNRYAEDILDCTGSPGGQLDTARAKARSPLYWNTPTEKFPGTEVIIHTGIYDGIQGSVPITQSINFYNKLLTDLEVTDPEAYVSPAETLYLLETRLPLKEYGLVAGRKVCLRKQYQAIRLLIFQGNHEMLPGYALDELLNLEMSPGSFDQ